MGRRIEKKKKWMVLFFVFTVRRAVCGCGGECTEVLLMIEDGDLFDIKFLIARLRSFVFLGRPLTLLP